MKIKRNLLIVSFLIIFLLAVTAVSAAETNITDDSPVDLASSDNEEVSINNAIEDEDNSSFSTTDTDDLTNQNDEILQKSSEDALDINIEDDNATISNDDASSQTVLAATSNDDDPIAVSDETTIAESNLSNSSTVDADKIIDGFKVIFNGIDLNYTRIIEDIISNIDIDVNVSDFLINISDAFTFNRTAFLDAFDEFSSILNISANLTEKFSDFIANLNLNMTPELESIIGIINQNETYTLMEFYNLYDTITKTNNVSMLTLMKALSNITSGLDVQKIIDLIKDSDFNLTNLTNSLSLLIGAVTVNRTKLIDEIDNTFGINITKIDNFFDGITDIWDGIQFDKDKVIEGLKTIYEGFSANITEITEAFTSIIDEISIDKTVLENSFNAILKEFNITAKNFRLNVAKKIVEFLDYLDLVINAKALNDYIKIQIGEYNLSDVSRFFNEIITFNNLTVSKIADGLVHVLSGINVTEIIDDMVNPDFNFENFIKAITDITDSITISNKSKIYDGIMDIIKSIDYNETYLIDGLSTIYSGITFNFTSIINGLDKIIPKIDFDNFNFTNISKIIKFNISSILTGVQTIIGGFSANTTNIWNNITEIAQAVSFNETIVKESFETILKEFNTTLEDFPLNMAKTFFTFLDVLGPEINDEIFEELSNIMDEDGNMNITLLFKTMKDLYDYNNYTLSNISYALVATIEEVVNFTSIYKSILDPNFNAANIKNAIIDIINATTVNKTIISNAIDGIIGSIDYNMTKLYDGLAYIYDGVTLNFTAIKDAIEEFIDKIHDLIPKFDFDFKEILEKAITAMKDYLIVDPSSVVDGLSEIIEGIDINVSDIINGLAEKLNINPKRTPTQIVYSNMVAQTVNTKVDGKIGKYFAITLKDNAGHVLANKKVQIGYNGITYNLVTDKNGVAKLQINLPNAGVYTYSICFLGDDSYSGSYVTSKITVKKQAPKLTAKSKTTFKAKSKKKILKVTLKSAKGKAIKGKKITLKIKGKTYKAKTNKKSIAKIKVKLTKKGNYKTRVKFAGDNTYKKVSKKIKLRIK